jgi:hypothetical protein
MRSMSIVLVSCVLCSACAGEAGPAGKDGLPGAPGAPGAAGIEGAAGEAGANGAAGDSGSPGSSGDGGVKPSAEPVSGSRLKVRFADFAGPDGVGVSVFSGFVDSARSNEPCSALAASDGSSRCLPQPSQISAPLFASPDCTGARAALGGTTLKYIASAESVAGVQRYRMFSSTRSATTTYSSSSGPGSCTVRNVQLGESLYVDEIPLTEFAELNLSYSTR